MAGALGIKGAAFADAFAASLRFLTASAAIAAVQQVEPKQGKNVAETVHLLFKMTLV
jgi:hypothetical protein